MNRLCLLIVISILVLPRVSPAAEALVVAVASSMLAPSQILASQFEARYHQRVKLVSGSTGMLYAQMMHGAPYGVFMAADAETPEKLAVQLQLPDAFLATFATGRLFLCTRRGLPAAEVPGGIVAMADPRLAPYGEAARQVLADSDTAAAQKVIYVPNAAIAASHLQRGLVDAAFIASSAVTPELEAACRPVASSKYRPIQHRILQLQESPVAAAWFDFVRSPQAAEVWQQAGFEVEHIIASPEEAG